MFSLNSSRKIFFFFSGRTRIERSSFLMGGISKFYYILYLHDNGRIKEG